MNDERLYINGHQIRLMPGQPIAKTIQINDIGSLADRQANFTRNIDIPKTPENIIAFDYVGVVGSNSLVPYQKNTANYFVGNECLIYEGWANVTESSDVYKVNIYDGNIDFFKAIENKNITDVNVSALNHVKNLTNVIGSWSGGTDYRYMLADYNGKKTFIPSGETGTTEIINIDYLIPSANVKFIWDRIFDFYGYEYEGSVFENPDFTNLWLTFSKPVGTNAPNFINVIEQTDNVVCSSQEFPTETGIEYRTVCQIPMLTNNFTSPYAEKVGNSIKCLQSGQFKFSVNNTASSVFPADKRGCVLTIKNSAGIIQQQIEIIQAAQNFAYFTMQAGDTMTAASNATSFFAGNLTGDVWSHFQYVDGYEVNFEEIFIDFKIKDFVSEILQRFSLTMFPNKYEKKIEFLTTQEWLQTDQFYNWSNKNPKLLNTKYTLANYGQNNRFRYKYNDDNAAYNDGIINIANVNLPDEKVIIQSSIYSPENRLEQFTSFSSNVYKFWDKTPKEDGTIDYKALDGRFYFMRSDDISFLSPVLIGSEIAGTSTTISNAKKENFNRLKFKEIIANYYQPIASILNTSKIHNVELNLSVADVNSFDFRKLIYLEQFGSYFLMNKIQNFIPNKVTKCELIEVDYQTVLEPIEPTIGSYIIIDDIQQSGCTITITFTTDSPLPTMINLVGSTGFAFPISINNSFWVTEGNTISFEVPTTGNWEFRLYFSNAEGSFYSLPQSLLVDGCIPEVPEPECVPTFVQILVDKMLIGGQSQFKVRAAFDNWGDNACPPFDMRLEITNNLNGQTSTFNFYDYPYWFPIGSGEFLESSVSGTLAGNVTNANIKLTFIADSGEEITSAVYHHVG